jgi:beta-glucosidase
MVRTKLKSSRSGPGDQIGRGRRRVALALSWAVVTSGLAAFGVPTLAAADDTPAYKNASLPFSARAADLVSRMTLEEKYDQLRAMQPHATWAAKPKVITRLGVRSYGYWGEANHGIYFPTLSGNSNYTQYPQSSSIASTWNTDLTQQIGAGIADEARITYNTSCPPGVENPNPAGGACYGLTYWSPNQNLNRDPRWGRADESYSEDPALTSGIASAFVTGMQGDTASRVDTVPTGPNDYIKAVATPKHYLANNSEANRNYGTSNLTERTMLEYFVQPFAESAGTAGARSLMTAYNAFNMVESYTTDYPSASSFPTLWSPRDNVAGGNGTPGTPAAGSRYAIETLMRRSFGFDGFVVSDCDAITRVYGTGTSGHSWRPIQLGGSTQLNKTIGNAWALKAGTDLDCSGADYPSATGLTTSQDQGYATEADVDIALVRAFTARFQMGEFDPVASVPWNSDSYSLSAEGDSSVKMASPEHRAVAHESALEAPVLLKNEGSTLPFSGATTGKTVALGHVDTLNKFQSGSYSGPTAVNTTFAQALAAETGGLASDVTSGSATPYFSDHLAVFPDAVNTGGTAITTSKCATDPCDPIADANTAEYRMSKADNIVVVVGHRNNDGGEGSDRTTVALPRLQAELIRDSLAPIAKKYDKKVVVWIQAKTMVDLSAFKNLPEVGAIVWSSFNGMYQGKAMSELLFNDTVTLEDGRTATANFSGKLPLTWYSDVDAQLGAAAAPTRGIEDYRMTKAEGAKCGRTYLYYQVGEGCAAPDYVFGHGLSYSPFVYGTPTLSSSTITPDQSVKVSVQVTNQVANYLGKAVVQVYAKAPADADGNVRPLKQLKGFVKTGLITGTPETAELTLKAGDLWFWDDVNHKKIFPTGDWTILTGPSSADADLKSVTLTVTGSRTAGVEMVSAQPDGTELSLDTPDNRINAMLSVTKHDLTFWKLDDPALTVQYTSSDPSVASVDATGAVAPVAKGVALIKATATANGETKSTTFPVVVTSGAPDATGTAFANTHTALVDFADRTLTLVSAAAGTQLSAKLVPATVGAGYSYRIAPMDTNTAGASVSATGVLTAKRAGFVRVTATATDSANVKTSESALIKVAAVFTTDELQKALDAVRALNPATFTTSSWTAADLATVAAAAELVLANPTATQAEIETATSALVDGMTKLVYRGDPTVLATLIATATGLNGKLGSFTTASATAVSSALTEAQSVYAARADKTQAQLDTAASALQSALTGLVVAAPVVEKSVLQSAYDSVLAMSNSDGKYTSSSWSALQAKLTAAKTVLDNASATQAAVNTAATALTAALTSLVVADPAVDKSVLQSAYDAALALSNSNGKYTSSSWSALQAKVTAAKAVLDDGTASQVAVNTAANELTAALAGLVVADPAVNKAVLQSAYDAGKALSNSSGKYTSASWSKLQSELTDAKAVLDNASATQAAVDTAAQKLTEALAGLVVADPAVVKTVLQKAYDAGKALSNSAGTYTSASWSKLQSELTAAKAVLDNGSATQAAVDTATQSLTDALAGLVVATPAVVKSVLQSAYDAGKALSNSGGKYTSASWSKLQSELTDAKAVLDNASATQAAVDTAAQKLASALAGLVVADPAVVKTVLQKAYDAAKALSSAKYTSASWSKLQSELTDAKAVLDNGSATQAAVDTAAQELTAALAALEVADAPVDKAVLQHAYDAAKALPSDKYTSATWGALQREITDTKAILDNGAATQAQVDSALKELTSALAGLSAAITDNRVAIDDPAARFAVGDRVYTGSQLKSGFAVTMGDRRLYEGVDFVVGAAGANTKIGKGSITIIGKGDYSGSRLLEFKILPTKTSISKAKAGKKSVKVSYKKVSSSQQVSRYQVQYRVKGTASWKTVSVAASKSSVTLTKLKKGKVYQVQVRSYKVVSGATYYSAWSASKYSSKVK